MQQPHLSDVPGQALDIAKCLAVARADLDLNEPDEFAHCSPCGAAVRFEQNARTFLTNFVRTRPSIWLLRTSRRDS